VNKLLMMDRGTVRNM